MKSLISSILFVLSIVLVGCGAADSSIDRVTAIPEAGLPTATQTRSVDVSALSTPTITPTERASANLVTPTPLNTNLPAGSARQLAAATDAAVQPTPRTRLEFDQNPVPITFGEFYDGYSIRTGLQLSDKLVSLDGQEIVMEGYMAPPLKPELDYFVLTAVRLAFCPFCSTAADWPDDIALVYLVDDTVESTQYPVRVYGRIEVGSSVDSETGMVSLVRIYAERLEVLQ